jgi:hypothetical protein
MWMTHPVLTNILYSIACIYYP